MIAVRVEKVEIMNVEQVVDEVIAAGERSLMPFPRKITVNTHRLAQEVIAYVPDWDCTDQWFLDELALEASERLGTLILIEGTELPS